MEEEIVLWDNTKTSVNMKNINNTTLDVKGEKYNIPSRCLEIYANTKEVNAKDFKFEISYNAEQKTCYLPFLKKFIVPIGESINHPPFVWNDIEPSLIISNFIYNTNAIYRILKNLERQGLIPQSKINNLVDEACKTLCSIYKFRNHFVIKHINNNINMSLITKVIELNLGKSLFNFERQESTLTLQSLYKTMSEIEQYNNLTTIQLMAIAIGRGGVFYNNNLKIKKGNSSFQERNDASQTYKYFEERLAIDHRIHLIERIHCSNDVGKTITMSVILDDTSESILDLLWIQKLLIENQYLRINLILNKAQVSINFSSDMLKLVLANSFFTELASRINMEVKVHEIMFPLISFQPNLFNQTTLNLVNTSDLIYVKGLNFFETFQMVEKDIYYAFIVSGSVSELYTGQNNGDAVFAFVPVNKSGYLHHKEKQKIKTLAEISNKN